MYALRYGTVPMICRTGGLADTVIDVGDQGGVGLCFDRPSVSDILHTFNRAIHLYAAKSTMIQLQKKMMSINHSWEASCMEYIDLYQQIH
jgi:starch synthase